MGNLAWSSFAIHNHIAFVSSWACSGVETAAQMMVRRVIRKAPC